MSCRVVTQFWYVVLKKTTVCDWHPRFWRIFSTQFLHFHVSAGYVKGSLKGSLATAWVARCYVYQINLQQRRTNVCFTNGMRHHAQLLQVTPAFHHIAFFMSVHDVHTDAQRSSFILRCKVTTVVFIKILDFETSKEFQISAYSRRNHEPLKAPACKVLLTQSITSWRT
jgi:hypothetical protein